MDSPWEGDCSSILLTASKELREASRITVAHRVSKNQDTLLAGQS